ncbi:hypothetical protein LAZ67_4002774 [Cordylochernes scorpioides]|uniref:ATP-dependent DNA helicase n=1 Tax=Cordylochernes scorpioides TaxID=51811 RepID=A0ABY6KGH9_9ARAC|nr:hypothetical protein LAZ67_4002774 [Cordylochernes scorpioides]
MILIHIIQSKFDRSIRKEWEMSLLEKEYPSYENIISFLERFAGSLGSFQNKENSKQFYKMNKSTHSHSATFASGSSIDSRLAEWLPELLEAKVAAQLENPQQSQARLQSDRLRHRVKRASETPQQSQTRQEADRLRHFRQRASTWADMPNAAFHYNPALNYEQFTFLRLAIWINNAYTLIPDLPEPPEALRTLLDGFSPHSAEFMQRVRHYNNAGGLYFLDAPGGTGKTFLIILLLTKVRSTGDIALSTASSGIAATLLHGGRTAHSTFKLPLDLTRDEVPVCNLNADSAMGEVLRQCKFIIWDECTMAHRHALEAVDITLEDCRQDQRPMGGVVLLLAGDFRQILPIIPREATILTDCYQNEEVFIPRIPLIHDDKHSPLHFKRLQFLIRVSFAISINKAQETTILTGCFQNEEVFISRIPLIYDDKHSPLHFKRLQFPIRVTFAMSINKAQGQSLKIAGIDLEQPCFSHGQLYVACSRIGSGRNLYVLAPENTTSNFVYSSVLS